MTSPPRRSNPRVSVDPTADTGNRPIWVPMLASGLFHLALLLIAAVLMERHNGGDGVELDRPVGVAVVHRMPDRNRYVAAEPAEPADPIETPAETAAASSAAPPSAIAAIDLDGILANLTADPTANGSDLGGGLAGAAAGDARGTDAAPGAQPSQTPGSTMVFGVSGSGNRFVYVFDRSDSMNGFGGKPLRAAKRELIRSIGSLTDRQQFAIIFYNDRPTPLGGGVLGGGVMGGGGGGLGGGGLGGGGMMTAEPGMRITATRYIRGVAAYGGTEHAPAIEMALRMSPDVIFFLTDAAIPPMSSTQLRRIQTRAQSAGTTIHAIEFGSNPAPTPGNFLSRLAKQNGGQYRYLNVQDL